MKEYRLRQKCYCGGWESCNNCMPDSKDKRKIKRKIRKRMKRELQKQEIFSSEHERIWIKHE